ncbi:hypothetical protein HZC08_00025, partial [Candidatus Micrarchaeota archaeon]|nr:hypothetical protein [Candidatus Micrarchaeota archaeon]
QEKQKQSTASFRFEGDQIIVSKLQSALKSGQVPALTEQDWNKLRISRKASGQMFEYTSDRFQEYLTSHGYKQQLFNESKGSEETVSAPRKQFKHSVKPTEQTIESSNPVNSKLSGIAQNLRAAWEKAKSFESSPSNSSGSTLSSQGDAVLRSTKSGKTISASGDVVLAPQKGGETLSASGDLLLKANKKKTVESSSFDD